MDDETLSLRPRAYLASVRQLLLETQLRRAVVLLGPRRVGKTILIRHLIADLLDDSTPTQAIAYVEMDHPLLPGQSLEALVQQIEGVTLVCSPFSLWRPPAALPARRDAKWPTVDLLYFGCKFCYDWVLTGPVN